jgi:hypothetical protein
MQNVSDPCLFPHVFIVALYVSRSPSLVLVQTSFYSTAQLESCPKTFSSVGLPLVLHSEVVRLNAAILLKTSNRPFREAVSERPVGTITATLWNFEVKTIDYLSKPSVGIGRTRRMKAPALNV